MAEMNEKTQAELIEELQRLRQRIAELQESETQRTGVTETLRVPEAESRTLFHSIPDPVFVFDQETRRFLDCNQAAIDRYGYALDELRAMTPHQLHPASELQVVEKNINDPTVTLPHEYTHITKHGERLRVEIHTHEIEYRGQKAWISVARDITDRRQTEEALRASEERYRMVVENANEAILVIQEDRLRFVNAKAEQITGFSRDELTSRYFADFVHPDDREMAVDRYRRRLEGQRSYPFRIVDREGNIRWVESNTITVHWEGKPASLSFLDDVTERKRAEEALQKAHEELEQYAASLERQTAQLQVASEVARDAATIRNVPRLLNETVHLVSDRFGFYHAGIFLVDEQNEYAVLQAASSEGGRRMLERGYKLQVGEDGIIGYVAATGEPRIVLDVGADAVFFDNPDLPDTRSEMVLPMNLRGRTIGLLDVQSTQEAAFSADNMAVLQTLADQLASALENARLVERAEAQVRELSMLYGEYSAAAWDKLASPAHAAGYVYDRIDVLPAEKLSPPALDLALEHGETVTVVEPETTEAVLATPLKLREQIIGALGIQETDEAREWSPHEIALVEAVSEQVALALENARLFAETQKSAQTMQALYETSRVLSSTLEEETLMRAILEAVYHTLGCEHVIISTVDRETETIGIQHGIWNGDFDVFPEWIQNAQYPLDHPDILADVCRTGHTEIIGEWDERFNREIWEEYGHERLLRVFMPIKLRDQVMGVVEVAYDRHEKGHIVAEETQMLAAFMDQAAVALENVRLFRQAQRRAQREHQTYEITAKIRRSLDVSTILQTAVDELGKALHTDRALIQLRVKPRQGRDRHSERSEESY